MSKSLRFAIDYDNTWTADRKTFAKLASLLLASGHEVVMVTLRRQPPDEPLPFPIYCSAYKAKRKHMTDLGVPVDIWIDDNPEWIDQDYSHPLQPHWT